MAGDCRLSGMTAEARAGLCARCAHAAVQRSARGSEFWRCRRADAEPAYRRYPPLPVLRCAGFEEGGTLPSGRGEAGPASGPAGGRPRERGER
jgi:hypothetical protein